MSLSLNKPKLDNLAGDIWKSAERLRGKVGLSPIPLPPLTVQDEICHYLDAKLSELKRIAAGIESQIGTLTAYRKSLIHECVTGQRRVTEDDLRRALGAGILGTLEQAS
jgi:hypothetical protein